MKKYFFILTAMLCLFSSSFANNVRMEGVAKVTEVTSNIATIEFSLKWDNAWRDTYNWDAVWVFLKYKTATGDWKHVNLEASGHTFSPENSYTYFPGKNGTSTVGLFILYNELKTGNPSMTCQLKWTLPSDVTQASFDNNEAFLLAQGIEMVYIPYGAYQLGEKDKVNAFDSVFFDSESARQITIHPSTKVSLAATYPKAYAGYYMMKAEISQEQYSSFLNTLTLAQQQTLLPKYASLDVGDYIFGSSEHPSNRNGILLAQKPEAKPMIFDNNLTADALYAQSDDGQNVACNYMSVNAMLAYCSWTGLRPMSELEFEKACRLPLPIKPKLGEYVWGSSDTPVFASGISNENKSNEQPAKGQVNAGGILSGPLRCGSFVASSAGQANAGLSYWGVMELGGNLREICASATNTRLSSSTHGSGVCNTTTWGSTPSWFGYRGGSFRSEAEKLQTADRSEMSLITDLAHADSLSSFRGVRSFDAGVVTINPGTISIGDATICPGSDLIILSSLDASVVGMSAVPLTYIWYVNNIIQEGNDASLKLSLVQGTTYAVRRKAICMLGEQETTLSVVVPAVSFSLSSTTACLGSLVTASNATYTYSWSYKGVPIGTGQIYSPVASDFNGESGDLTVQCEATPSGCSFRVTQDLIVKNVYTTSGCGDLTFDGYTYSTVIIGDLCWMSENLRSGGTFDATHSPNYGNYFTWVQATDASPCPSGWRLPTHPELCTLVDIQSNHIYFGCQLGGYRKNNGSFGNLGTYGQWWSSNAYNATGGWALAAGHAAFTYGGVARTYGLSVRCVRNQ